MKKSKNTLNIFILLHSTIVLKIIHIYVRRCGFYELIKTALKWSH